MDGSKEGNNKKGLAKGTREEVKFLNHYLEELKAKLMNCYQEMQIHKQLITAEAIKNKFLGTDEKGHTRYKVVTYHNTQMKDSLGFPLWSLHSSGVCSCKRKRNNWGFLETQVVRGNRLCRSLHEAKTPELFLP